MTTHMLRLSTPAQNPGQAARPLLISVDDISSITMEFSGDARISMTNGDTFRVVETYSEVRDSLQQLGVTIR